MLLKLNTTIVAIVALVVALGLVNMTFKAFATTDTEHSYPQNLKKFVIHTTI